MSALEELMSPFEAAAVRTRNSVRPEFGRREGVASHAIPTRNHGKKQVTKLVYPKPIERHDSETTKIAVVICARRIETNNIGAGTPFTVKQLSPSAVGRGIWLVARFTGLSSLPKRDTREPGATPWVWSAALTIRSIFGAATDAS